MFDRILNRAQSICKRLIGFLGRYLETQFIRFTAITFLILGFLNLIVACWTSEGGINIYGSWAGGDYSCFYVAGTILNEYSPDRLYDFGLQSQLLHSLLPKIPHNSSLPFINPPFFALLFRPLSLLPYMSSYLSWAAITIALYFSGLVLLRKTLQEIPSPAFNLAILLSLSFEPFMMETVMGGNSSAFAFFAVALAVYLERRERPIASGMAFGLCFYKPTFLVLILPVLLVTRRLKTLMGVLICVIVLSCISVLTLGSQVCLEYIQILFNITDKTRDTVEVFRTFKYVDITSFFRLLFKEISPGGWISIGLGILIPITFLVIAGLKLNQKDQNRKDLIFAGTLAWTPVFNLHFAIYDTIIVVIAILLALNVWYRYSNSNNAPANLPPLFKSLLVMLYLMPLFSQQIALFSGVQIFTIVLAATGGYMLTTARYCKFI